MSPKESRPKINRTIVINILDSRKKYYRKHPESGPLPLPGSNPHYPIERRLLPEIMEARKRIQGIEYPVFEQIVANPNLTDREKRKLIEAAIKDAMRGRYPKPAPSRVQAPESGERISDSETTEANTQEAGQVVQASPREMAKELAQRGVQLAQEGVRHVRKHPIKSGYKVAKLGYDAWSLTHLPPGPRKISAAVKIAGRIAYGVGRGIQKRRKETQRTEQRQENNPQN